MNDPHLSLHLKNFNDKVKFMNQTGKQNLTLTAAEARSLHADLFDLLNHCAQLSKKQNQSTGEQIVQIAVDGGGFK